MTPSPWKVNTVYPVGLRLGGRRVVVVGGGQVGHRRAVGLAEAGADVLVVSPAVTVAVESMASRAEITWERRPYVTGDLAGAWYAVAATDDPAVNAAVAAEAEAARIFCARAEDASASSAWTPAVGRHGDLTVAVQGGGDPRRAVGVRDGVLAALGDGTLADRAHRNITPGVVLVGGGPGDPGLITVRGRQALGQADVVVADHLAPQALLAQLPSDVTVIDASKLPGGRAMAQEAINELLVEHARAGRRVVRLKGGDPFVFGRGMEEVMACVEAGVPIEVVPGVTSAIAVPGVAGIPVTHRGVAHEFVVVSGHLPPGDPRSQVDWPSLGRLHGTLVLLMAVDNAAAIVAALINHGRPPETPAAVIQDGGLPGQRILTCRLDDLADQIVSQGFRPPVVIVIGDVVDLVRAVPTLPLGNVGEA